MTTTVTITSGSFASDATMVISDLSQALIVDSTSLTKVYVPFSATSVCSVSLTFDDSYSAYGGYNVIKLERMANTYVIYFELDKDNEITRYSNFDITVNACSKHTSKSTTITIEQEACESENFIVFTAQQDNSSISLTNIGGNTPNIKISLDSGSTWSTWDYNGITLDSGHSVYMRGMNPSGFSVSFSKYSQFGMTGKISVGGNIMSLIDYTKEVDVIPCQFCFVSLFYLCYGLYDAGDLKLPATTLTDFCYGGMFFDCSALTRAPELPATALTNYCYDRMFNSCARLNYIKCLAVDGIGNHATTWVGGVASTGTFVKHPDAVWPISYSGIPSGWTVENYTGN